MNGFDKLRPVQSGFSSAHRSFQSYCTTEQHFSAFSSEAAQVSRLVVIQDFFPAVPFGAASKSLPLLRSRSAPQHINVHRDPGQGLRALAESPRTRCVQLVPGEGTARLHRSHAPAWEMAFLSERRPAGSARLKSAILLPY